MGELSKLWFPAEYFVGIRAKKDSETDRFPLGFATPTGTDKAAEKRMQTVREWTGSEYYKKLEPGSFLTIKNEPIEGFRITQDVRRYETNMQWWRIEDPRGFEVEISSRSLSRILLCSGINKGVIEGKCLYARNGAKNDLIPENSPEYQAVLESTIKRFTPVQKIAPHTVPIGATIRLKGNSYNKDEEYYFYGKVSCVVDCYERPKYFDGGQTLLETKTVERYMLIEKNHVYGSRLVLVSSLNILEVTNTWPEFGPSQTEVCDNFWKYSSAGEKTKDSYIDILMSGVYEVRVKTISPLPMKKVSI